MVFSDSLTIEYAVRLWVSPVRSNKSPLRAIAGYAFFFLGLVDLFVVLPYWLSFLFRLPDWCVMMAAFLSLLKLARFVPGLGIFISVFRTEGHSLLAALIVLIVLLIFAAGTIYVLENPGQPEIFASFRPNKRQTARTRILLDIEHRFVYIPLTTKRLFFHVSAETCRSTAI